MIKRFRHKGLERFFKTGNKAGIQPSHADKLKRQLITLDQAESADEMDVPGWRLHPLTGNWRLTFAFVGKNAVLVDYQDYH